MRCQSASRPRTGAAMVIPAFRVRWRIRSPVWRLARQSATRSGGVFIGRRRSRETRIDRIDNRGIVGRAANGPKCVAGGLPNGTPRHRVARFLVIAGIERVSEACSLRGWVARGYGRSATHAFLEGPRSREASVLTSTFQIGTWWHALATISQSQLKNPHTNEKSL